MIFQIGYQVKQRTTMRKIILQVTIINFKKNSSLKPRSNRSRVLIKSRVSVVLGFQNRMCKSQSNEHIVRILETEQGIFVKLAIEIKCGFMLLFGNLEDKGGCKIVSKNKLRSYQVVA